MLEELELNQMVWNPTRPGSRPSLIDHIITNVTNTCQTAEVIKAHASDHDLITVTVPLARVRKRPRTILTRSLRNVDWNHLCLDLLQSDWSKTARERNRSADQM